MFIPHLQNPCLHPPLTAECCQARLQIVFFLRADSGRTRDLRVLSHKWCGDCRVSTQLYLCHLKQNLLHLLISCLVQLLTRKIIVRQKEGVLEHWGLYGRKDSLQERNWEMEVALRSTVVCLS